MKPVIKGKIKNILNNEEFWLILFSFCFAFIICLSKIAGDDAVHVTEIGSNIFGWWERIVEQWFSWSSRVLVNFVGSVVLGGGRIIWMLYMAISSYVMLKAMVLLFSDGKKREIAMFAIFTLMLFPFRTLMTAGWIAATTSYFGPQAFALMSMVPIKKVVKNEKICWWESILYAACLIYGTNAEQFCIVILILYLAAIIYLFTKKRSSGILWINFALTAINFIAALACPGNKVRSASEEINWFPTYRMLDFIDKADIGISTTLKWIFVDGGILILVMCIVLAFFIWQKYKEPLFRFVSVIPVIVSIGLGPLRDFFTALFPDAAFLMNDIDYYGAFNVQSLGRGVGTLQFAIFLLIAACVCAEIILLNDTIEGFLTDILLIVMGVASRCAMGFSPTVYASSTRTYTTLVVCFMAVLIHIYSKNYNLVKEVDKNGFRYYVYLGIIFLKFVDLIFLVATAFY